MKEVLRMCVVCRQMKNKKDLIRVVKTNNSILIDNSGKIDGRGAYVCKCKACLEKLEKTKALNRAFKMPIDEKIIEKLLELKEFWWQIIKIKGL